MTVTHNPPTAIHEENPTMAPDTDPTTAVILGDHLPVNSSGQPASPTTIMMEELLSDLTTYRFIPQVAITPEMARRIIELDAENNRNLKPRVKERYARDMRTVDPATGRRHWRERTGQVLNIDTRGRLINGKHRMHALIEAGVTLKFDICMGVEPRDIVAIDSGAGRSTNDVVRISGGRDLSGIGAIVRWVLAWDRRQFTGTSGNFTPTPVEILERAEAELSVFTAAAARGKDSQNRGLTPNRVAGVAYYLLRRVDAAEADDFFDQFISGLYDTSTPENSAIYRLREKMIRRRSLKLSPWEQLAFFITAWNRHHTWKDGSREPVVKLQLTQEGPVTNANFPQPRKPRRF